MVLLHNPLNDLRQMHTKGHHSVMRGKRPGILRSERSPLYGNLKKESRKKMRD
jgi:hypothetical protein